LGVKQSASGPAGFCAWLASLSSRVGARPLGLVLHLGKGAAALGRACRCGATLEGGAHGVAVDGLVGEQVLDQAVEGVAAGGEKGEGPLLGFAQKSGDLLVDHLLGSLGVGPPLDLLASE